MSVHFRDETKKGGTGVEGCIQAAGEATPGAAQPGTCRRNRAAKDGGDAGGVQTVPPSQQQHLLVVGAELADRAEQVGSLDG